jgi:hypothetical protein
LVRTPIAFSSTRRRTISFTSFAGSGLSIQKRSVVLEV